MSLNTVSLPPSLLVALYQKSLVQDITSPVPFLGKNAKNILVVVNSADAPFLPDGQLAFLTNVLSACTLGLMDVAIVNWQNRAGADAASILSQLNSKAVVLFDVAPVEFGLPADLPHYRFVQPAGVAFVSAPALKAIENNKEAKRLLWGSLKQLFGV